MNDFKIRLLKAKHGDSFLIFLDTITLLIDGGPSGVYRQYLEPQLKQLTSKDGEPPVIDLMMVSHIDADHIDGILDLTTELIEADDEDRQPIVNIRQAWHNSFSDVIAAPDTGTSREIKTQSANASQAFDELIRQIRTSTGSSGLVLSSVSQGRQLRLDLKRLQIDLNRGFQNRIVIQGGRTQPWRSGNLSIHVLGPTKSEVENLKKTWKKALPNILGKNKPAALASAKKLDRSVSNLASIVCIVEADNKTILLTGDARGDNILQWLKATDWPHDNGVYHFDAIKLPHHGSDRNVDSTFFETVTANHYLISGNGGHGNPEPATFELLFQARPELNYRIHMTYSPEELATNNTFIHEGNVPRLHQVLADHQRQNQLNWPAPGADYVDITL